MSSDLAIDTLSEADIVAGLALSEEAGWNQTAEDWALILRARRGFGVRESDGRLVATAAALPYDGPYGVVAMVLVTAAHRRRGFATRLVRTSIEALESRGQVPVLDATPAGSAVYGAMGFRPIFTFERWELAGGALDRTVDLPDSAPDVGGIDELDAAASGADRAVLLDDFLARPGTHVVSSGDGFALVREGRLARQVGPVVASGEDKAVGLIDDALSAVTGRAFIDVPTRWGAIRAWLEAHGGRVQRPFTRMALGRDHPFGDPSRLFAVAGPEFG